MKPMAPPPFTDQGGDAGRISDGTKHRFPEPYLSLLARHHLGARCRLTCYPRDYCAYSSQCNLSVSCLVSEKALAQSPWPETSVYLVGILPSAASYVSKTIVLSETRMVRSVGIMSDVSQLRLRRGQYVQRPST